MSWRALLEGEDAARAAEAIRAIAAELNAVAWAEPGLNSGHSGRAVLEYYLALGGDEAAGDRAVDALEQALDGIDQPIGPWILDGVAGIAWTSAHLVDLVDIDAETFDGLDRLIGRLLAVNPWTHEWEYILGLSGLGVYALERPAPACNPMLARIVEHLAVLAERADGAITWRSPTTLLLTEARRQDNPDGYYNAGLAHGVAGVIILLAEAVARGVSGAAELLPGAVTWLRSLDSGDPLRRFPLMIARGVGDSPRRDGWCYGDQSSAVALVRAGQVMGETAWIEHGLATARDVARREPGMPIDAAFCHGALGRAHMFNRLAQTSGDDELAEAARRWYRDTLDRRGQAPGSLGGFVCSDGPEHAASILMGSIGIALGLLAAVSTIEPGWDRAFLIALPPQTG